MVTFTPWIVQPRGWPHSRMFVDLASAIAHSLRELGHDVAFDPGPGPFVANPEPRGTLIVFGANYLPEIPLPDSAIIYNTEQVPNSAGPPLSVEGQVLDEWVQGAYLRMLRRHTVWDYSHENIRRLRMLGVEDVHHCGVGYSPVLERIKPAPAQDIDVLFYGTMSPRRQKVLAALDGMTVTEHDGSTRSLIVAGIQGLYGADLDAVIARSKVVLNMHINDPGVAPRIFQMVRVALLLANRKCVVTEGGGEDAELEEFARMATVIAPSYEQIAETCSMAVTRQDRAHALSDRGYTDFRRIDQTENVRRALGGCE